MRCPACTVEVADPSSLSCPSCGASLDESFAPTRKLPAGGAGAGSAPSSAGSSGRKAAASRPTPTLTSIHDTIDQSRFVAGTILADRYRLVGLLGRGGMGEVYRAEDLKLTQPVALKFLPESLSVDGAALARFHREVRIARQISHRNVCRVYDIGEAEGLHFLSMEYVRGEELSSVMRRFGRLPADKAVEIARQMCAGLAAAHEAGVLHRDLKPGNIMIDERGNVRVMDFGLAGLAEEFKGGVALEGTPEYMSPEQFTGGELAPQSDIYSLGLVLYELFTGKKAFTANTLPDLIRLRRSGSLPDSPSSLVRDLDPVVERVIERCLSPDPKDRPATALQVAAALPGGDPLAAALAAGETPSPEMVAAAPKQGALRPAVAAALLATAVASLAVAVVLARRVFLHGQVPLEKSAQVLRERGREVAKKFGYAEGLDETAGFYTDGEYLLHVAANDRAVGRWERLKKGQPAALGFWYRSSPRYLVPFSHDVVGYADPPHTVSGMAAMRLDTEGRLTAFHGVPPQVIAARDESPPPPAFDWSALFAEAGLDASKFRQVEPRWSPPQAFDAQAAWEGAYDGQPDLPVRIEAAAFRGRPVYFELVHPWTRPSRQQQFQVPAGANAMQAVLIGLFVVMLFGAVLLARHNLRLGRGDRKGAFRLAGFAFALAFLIGVFGAHHVPAFEEFGLFMQMCAFALLMGGMIWLVYVALEPFVRRRWPSMIIAWNRLLAGDYRDPLVGRDLLLGAAFGFGMTVVEYLPTLLPAWLGWPPPMPRPVLNPAGLLGPQQVVNMFLAQALNSLLLPSAVLFLLLLLTMIVRRRWLAAVLLSLVFPPLVLQSSDYPLLDASLAWLSGGVYLFVLIRFGLLAFVFTQFFGLGFNFFLITHDLSAWYAGGTIFTLVVTAALLAFGFHTSRAGQKLFSGSLVDD
ncbi:MAG TPA: serine/threonine-protein kinase [Pyrinomonadaceae bacterium]|nr:serine/threonine-protein kinase [Pyrinomonadaceae bacterium]